MYWLTNFLLINSWARDKKELSIEVVCTSYKKGKKQIIYGKVLQLIGIIVIKSKATRVVTYTCKHFSGH